MYIKYNIQHNSLGIFLWAYFKMKYGSGVKDCFKWPNLDDILSYEENDILCKLNPPVPLNRRGDYKFSDEDFEKAQHMFVPIARCMF